MNKMHDTRGQSFVEVTLFLPIFLLIMAGIADLGWFINRYLDLTDTSREVARFVSDLDPGRYDPRINMNSPWHDPSVERDCDATVDFYMVGACYAEQILPIDLRSGNGYDDIVITAYAMDGSTITRVYPPDSVGWSLYGNQETTIDLTGRLDALAPRRGFVVVEIFYMHQNLLRIWPITMFLPDGIGIYTFTAMPNPTAGTRQ